MRLRDASGRRSRGMSSRDGLLLVAGECPRQLNIGCLMQSADGTMELAGLGVGMLGGL